LCEGPEAGYGDYNCAVGNVNLLVLRFSVCSWDWKLKCEWD
jgi:hypothetical protein